MVYFGAIGVMFGTQIFLHPTLLSNINSVIGIAIIIGHERGFRTWARRQHRLSAAERRGNLLGVFEPTEKTKNLIAGKRILLADDICTTCSTLNEAAKTLMIFGAERVDCD